MLALRATCLARHDTDCILGVAHAGSALAEADTHLLRDSLDGGVASGAPDLSDVTPTLVDRTGASALLRVTSTSWPEGSAAVSVHVIRSLEGWRLRDILVE